MHFERRGLGGITVGSPPSTAAAAMQPTGIGGAKGKKVVPQDAWWGTQLSKLQDRVIESLRERGIEVKQENAELIQRHFQSLPNRYAHQIRGALAEVLIHVSLLEECREQDGKVAHCLRPVIARLPVGDEAGWEEYPGGTEATPATLKSTRVEMAQNRHPMISATPMRESILSSELEIVEEDVPICGHERTTDCDCFELTIAMKERTMSLGKIIQELGEAGLNVAETHGFRTADHLSLYWFILEGWGMENLDGLDCLLRSRLPLFCRRKSLASTSASPIESPGVRPVPVASKPDKDEPLWSVLPETPHKAGTHEPSVGLKRSQSSSGMKRDTSFLNLWKLDVGVGQINIADWEIDPDELAVHEAIGRGSFGTVYRGEYRGEVVAVKYITSSFSKAFENIKEFMQEISLLSTVKHENIVHFIGACTKQANVCIIYEYMDGGSVKEFLARTRHKPSEYEMLGYALSVAKGMAYLSSMKVIHRDIKSQNVLITASGKVKIGDFGVARLLPHEDECMTAETGTYRWMAPEVIEHRPYGIEADVYSFGVFLWELATYGKMPYALLSPVQAAVGVAKHGMRPKIPSRCSPEVAELMKSCWETQPSARPSFDDVVDAISRIRQASSQRGAAASRRPKSGLTGMFSKFSKS